MSEEPIVFISYSHDGEEHEKWVLRLATHLTHHGINFVFDQWDLQLGNDLRFFMEDGISKAKWILCICSEEYVKKVDSGYGGSGYEGMIMTQALLRNAKNEHIIAIVRNNFSAQKVPLAFTSKLYLDFSDDEQYYTQYKTLLERIYGETSKRKPLRGINPFATTLAERIDVKTRIESIKYYSPEMKGEVKFHFDNNNGRYVIGIGEYMFNTRWSRSGNNSIHVYGDIGFKNGCEKFPSFEDLYGYDFSSEVRTLKKGEIVIYKNTNNHFAAIKIGDVKSRCHGSSYDELIFEYCIYEK